MDTSALTRRTSDVRDDVRPTRQVSIMEEVDELKDLQDILHIIDHALSYFSNMDRMAASKNMTFKVKHSPLQIALGDAREMVQTMIGRRRDAEESKTAIQGGSHEWPTRVLKPESSI